MTTKISSSVLGGNLSLSGVTTLTGTLNVSSSVGTSGQVLISTGTGLQWSTTTGGGSSYSNTYSLTGTTTNSTETELFIGGTAGNRIPVPSNKSVSYTIDVAGRRTDVVGDVVFITLKGTALNNAGTTTDIGSIYEVIVARSDVNYLADCRANNTTDTINVYVTGVAGRTLSWKAVVSIVEI
jgi:hypothetical protein